MPQAEQESQFLTENRILRWLKRFIEPKPSFVQVTVANAYDVLVLGAGPASGSDRHIGSVELRIPDNKLSDFIVKRLYLHETFLFAAFGLAELKDAVDPEPATPFTLQMAGKLQKEWAAREGETPSLYEIGERCFGVVDQLTNDPLRWSRSWLSEFNEDRSFLAKHAPAWADQCSKELLVVKRIAIEHVSSASC